MPQVSIKRLDVLRLAIQHEISSEGGFWNPILHEPYLDAGYSEQEAVKQLFKMMVQGRKNGQGGFPTFAPRVRNDWYGSVKMRSAIWNGWKAVFRACRFTGRDQLPRNYEWMIKTSKRFKVHPHVLADLIYRYDKALTQSRMKSTFHPKRVMMATYLRTTEYYAPNFKLGHTGQELEDRYAEDKVYGPGETILAIPFDFEDGWKREYAPWKYKARGTIEIVSPKLLTESNFIETFAHLAFDGTEAKGSTYAGN